MSHVQTKFFIDQHASAISHCKPLQTLAVLCALLAVFFFGVPGAAFGQGSCIRAYGTPACNTDPIKPVFERTGWRTTALDHITFRVAEPQKEAAFYAALMGWKLRSDDGKQVVMDIGDWGTVIFKQAPPGSFVAPPAAAGGNAVTVPVRATVEGYDFDIEPWNAKAVEAELRKRGLNPVAENDGKGFESFHVKDLDGFDLQISNGQGYTKARRMSAAKAKLSMLPVRVDELANRVVGPPFVRCDKLQGKRLLLLQSSGMVADV
jgi:catechol 2,3-dioxygenase-like lactoylglutathione lyase family enzyme